MKASFIICTTTLLLVAVTLCCVVNGASLMKNLHRHRISSSSSSTTIPYTPDPFLQNWMGKLAPIIQSVTMMDISVSGSHDSGTYDLSSVFADRANDLPSWLAALLHDFRGIIDDLDLGYWIRNQAKTQGLTFTQQLDSGLRFIDFRIDYTTSDSSNSGANWYVMHMMESKQKAITYLQEMRAWMAAHPTEVVIFWFSHHGSPCKKNPYELAQNSDKVKFWNEIEQLFSGIMFDFSAGSLNTTTIGELQSSKQTAIFYFADYQNFTQSSKFASTSCQIDNDLPGDGTPQTNVKDMLNRYQASANRINADKSENRYYLMSGSGPDPKQGMIDAFELAFLGPLHLINASERARIQTECANIFDVPGSTWCPLYLQENSQWANYYHQIPFEYAITQQKKDYEAGKQILSFRFPNAIYIDGVDVNGTIRTGSEIFWPANYTPSPSSSSVQIPTYDSPHLDAKYSYTDTLLLSNVFWICSGGIPVKNPQGNKPTKQVCDQFISMLEQRRALFPFQEWTDLTSGRLKNYPPYP